MTKIASITKDQFQEEVLNQKVPVLVDFSTDGCGPCEGIVPMLEELQDELDGKLQIKNLNVAYEELEQDSNEVLKQYDVMAFPTLLVFKDGEPVETLIGMVDRGTVLEKLDGVI
ncbi:Thioredoxin [Lentibacillus sp. JNUCC-1]|uniref:thioredoxin family protein n=1 Tax=Lentibacillus sp. JNUCC-1 TaxID=2654513 RepID=UPI0012E90FD5|nr:thioredoxin domain-containing protein [Lentibacillus sp. JNUCC-1]MUV38205.1 Thioredoxin [Lentibacillus sp. JNUCC-1]